LYPIETEMSRVISTKCLAPGPSSAGIHFTRVNPIAIIASRPRSHIKIVPGPWLLRQNIFTAEEAPYLPVKHLFFMTLIANYLASQFNVRNVRDRNGERFPHAIRDVTDEEFVKNNKEIFELRWYIFREAKLQRQVESLEAREVIVENQEDCV
jgi:hypothetical protein